MVSMAGRPSKYLSLISSTGLPSALEAVAARILPSLLRRLPIAPFRFDDGMFTVCLPVSWALRMRVNRSAMGSVMLMKTSFRVHRYPRNRKSILDCGLTTAGLLYADHRL